MNFSELEIKKINRLIAHEIHPKTSKELAFVNEYDSLLKFQKKDQKILNQRLKVALENSKKTFKLEFEDKTEYSFFNLLNSYDNSSDENFIQFSIDTAEKLAEAHFRTKIPGGYCVVGEGESEKGEEFIFIIKAELQEVFNIKEDSLNVIENVFLSPAKDFYKIGFFIKNTTSFIPYMYDDLFNLQKKDLTEYFYGKFLGLTTDKNDKLRCKNFYNATKEWIDYKVNNIQDKLGLFKALDVLYRENTTGIISPKLFSENHLSGRLKTDFEKSVISIKFPQAFSRDISLIDNKLKLQRISIPLEDSLSLVGQQDKMKQVQVISDINEESIAKLNVEINSGSCNKIVLIKEVS